MPELKVTDEERASGEWVRMRINDLIDEYEELTGKTYSQRELAEAMGISESTLSRYRKGYIEMFSRYAVTRMMQFFGVGPGEFFELPGPSNAKSVEGEW